MSSKGIGTFILGQPLSDAEQGARAKIAEGMVELGVNPDEATNFADECVDLAHVYSHLGSMAIEPPSITPVEQYTPGQHEGRQTFGLQEG